MEPSVPSRYRLDAVLGRGAMGVVYKAYDSVIDRPVAIKVIHTDLLDGEEKAEFLAFFKREAQAAGRCMHARIVTIYDFSDAGECPFIAMEFVEGETLHALLRREKRLAVAVATAIVLQVLDGLGYAHRMQVVHRDIKPSNIMLQRGGEVKITDFGVARVGLGAATQAGMVGTPSYMSPEQLTGGAVDGRSDLFATGAMFYEMLTGAKPFPGGHAGEIAAMVLHGDPADPAQLGVTLPWALESVLRRAMAKPAAERFQSAEDFARSLRLAVDDEPATPIPLRPDATVVVPSRGVAPPGRSESLWDQRTLEQVERDLAGHLGPMARVLVKQAAGSSGSVSDLYRSLAPHIRDEAQRTVFLRKANRGGDSVASKSASPSSTTTGRAASGASASAILPEQVTAAQQELTRLVGPIARVLVKQALAEASSPRDFFNRLLVHIKQDADRAAFRRALGRDWGPDLPR